MHSTVNLCLKKLAVNWQTCAEAGACYGAKRKLFKLCVISIKSDVNIDLNSMQLVSDMSHPLFLYKIDERRLPSTCFSDIDERHSCVPLLLMSDVSHPLLSFSIVSFSDDEFVIGPRRSTATHDNDRK
jgi:hypothetical protein